MNFVTKEDLFHFKEQLLEDVRKLFETFSKKEFVLDQEGYKTKHVRKLLACCYNTVQSLRVSGKLRWKKIGGTVYYNKEDVQKMVNDGFK